MEYSIGRTEPLSPLDDVDETSMEGFKFDLSDQRTTAETATPTPLSAPDSAKTVLGMETSNR